jgi:hypothetical protein
LPLSILYTIGSFEGVFELFLAEFAIAVLVQKVDEIDDFLLGRGVLLTHVQQRVLDQPLHFLLVQHVVVVGVVLLEKEMNRLLNLFSGVAQFVILRVSLLLHVLAIERGKGTLGL